METNKAVGDPEAIQDDEFILEYTKFSDLMVIQHPRNEAYYLDKTFRKR